jgi:hypothetical protein
MLIKITDDITESIRKTDPHRHKYADAMAEYLDFDANMRCDRDSGDVECGTGWFAEFGKRILCHDERGFVWVEKWPNDLAAEQVFNAMQAYYEAWDDENPDYDDDLPEGMSISREAMLELLDAHLFYVAQCATESKVALDLAAWQVAGQPRGTER